MEEVAVVVVEEVKEGEGKKEGGEKVEVPEKVEERSIEFETSRDNDCEIFVVPAFIKPGRHSYFIQTSPKDVYFHKLIAPVRDEDLPISKDILKLNLFLYRCEKFESEGFAT
jgi:hypothetical protein